MKIKNNFYRLLVIVLFVCCLPMLVTGQQRPSGEAAKSYVAYLASDALEGRDTGTRGFEKAANWAAEMFRNWGITPAGNNGSYFQSFPFSYLKYEFEVPKLIIGKRTFDFEDRDFSVLRYSGGGKVRAEVVFVGFGISAPDRGLDEYAGVDVKNKIVLVMHGCPQNDQKKWQGVHSDSAKAAVAQQRGAIGMLLCADFGAEDRSLGSWALRPGNFRPNFIAFGVDERVVKSLLRRKDETNQGFARRLREQFDRLNKELQPISHSTGKKATLAVKVEYDPKRIGKNVLGMIKGTDPLVGNEAVVIGGHLDHVGVQYGQVYNGAEDNASGASVVLEVARVMMANNIQPKRSIIFACWGGEERGLLGSSYYATHPAIPIEKTVLNLNLDMVGQGNKLGFPGIYYAPEIWALIQENMPAETLEFLEPSRGGPGGSDHTPFITRGVPAFALMTAPWNAHTDYHQPGDDVEKISAELLGKVAQFVCDVALLVANADGNLIVENRLPRYIHKSASIVNLHPIAYEPGLSLLDSLQRKWIDVQFVTVSLDSLQAPSCRLAELIRSLDAASQEESDISRMLGGMERMFRARGDKTNSIVGLQGVASVNGDPTNLRIAGRLGAKFFIFDGVDGQWVTEEEGLTSEGKKAITTLNDQKMLIVMKALPESAIIQASELSRHPIVIAGVSDISALSDSLVQRLAKNGGLIALSFCPSKIDKLVEQIEAFKARVSGLPIQTTMAGPVSMPYRLPSSRPELTLIGLYPSPKTELDISSLDQMLNLTIALHQKGYGDQDIRNILGENLQSILNKINPREPRQMRRPF